MLALVALVLLVPLARAALQTRWEMECMQRASLGPLLPELTRFGRPPHLLLPGGCPELALLLEVLTRWSCYQIDVVGSMPMRLAALLSLVLLSPGVVYAHDSHKARASDKSQEVATAKVMRRVPRGATVTDTSCKKLNYVFQTRWRCTTAYGH